ncbi:MAG: capsule assembly Wzi family protein [Bacteroidota bacterium]|jgi:hypothetical protein|nr:capsule assembly Wzi family protein [Bacteroidota bacterium]
MSEHPLRFSFSFAAIAACLFLLLLPAPALSQAEHVEVGHPVYHFLHRMQLRGVLPRFSRSMLPLERKEVTALLRELATAEATFTRAEHALRARFMDEFVAEADGTQDAVELFGTAFGDLPARTFSDREKFLHFWRSPDGESHFAAEFLASMEYRALFDPDGAANVTLAQMGGRFRGTLGGVLGFSLRATNGTAIGTRALAMRDQQLRRNFNFADLDKDFFDFSEAWLGATWSWGSAGIGREKRTMGSGISNQILLSTNAEPFDALQFSAHAGALRFHFIHGFLLSSMERLADGHPYYDSKYVAIHRAEADIARAVRLGVFESVIYSSREVDPSYLNPVNFYKSAEHAGGDRDNPMLGIDLATLFIPGWQLYGSWLIDDVDFSRLGEDWWGNKFLWQGGVMSASLLPNTDLTIEYTRIDPYVYTHRYGANQYAHDGNALGVELAPNSDEWYVGIRHWFGAELWLQLDWHHRRHGRNELAADGSVLVNHGADIHESLNYERDSETAPFLDGPRDNTDMFTATLRWEPWRNIIFQAAYRYRDLRSVLDGPRRDHFLSTGLFLEY